MELIDKYTTEELKNKVREFFENEKETIIDDLTTLFSVAPAGLAFFCEPITTARTKNDDKIEISMLASNDDILLESETLRGSCLMRLDIAANFMYNILKYCQEGEKNASKT